jgi:hypothetical protein
MPCAGGFCVEERLTYSGADAGVVYRIGARYQGIDIAAMLDDWLATGTLPAYVSIRFPGQPA